MDRRLNKVANDLRQQKDGRQYLDRMELERNMHQETQEALASKAQGEYYEGADVLDWMDRWFTGHEKSEPTMKR
jgi:predicted transcriptional regulator